ncbi:leucyl aminopeptidase [Clostridiaceae bacterium]|nr:leucyl aminopeptidase [Clostridiaceae bacterium]RKI12063.1 leucyl aminopeptidase [bacterium 1XD21-70]
MKYQELWMETNTRIRERYDLAMERIQGFLQEEGQVEEPFEAYFVSMARFVEMIEKLARMQLREEMDGLSLEELARWNHALYEDILPQNYNKSYANPDYAAEILGSGLGQYLSAFYAQLRGCIVFAYECRLEDITILCETLIELYNMFEEGIPEKKSVASVLYWFNSDYTDVTLPYRIREQLDPGLSFAKDIIMESDLSDLRYLYRFGEYISETEQKTAAFLNTLPEETIERMASAYTEGYRKGFEVLGRDLSKKSTVAVRYELGFERMIRAAVLQFKEMGLETAIYRAAVWSVTQSPSRKVGYHSASPNRQYDYDHRYDQAVYLDKAFKERKLAVLKTAYEAFRKEAAAYAGPAVVETFGEPQFEPVNKKAAWALSRQQEKLLTSYANESMPIVNHYIPADETSFTIIAFPVPGIGPDFEEIFAETIRINTLDYGMYQKIQQDIIRVLEQAEYVQVTGGEGNDTDIRVTLHPLRDVERETNFENCVADVNIPLGEVFTSPRLAGTQGLLHVGRAYLGGIQFKDLRLWFQDGMVVRYSCENFEDPEEGKKLIRQEILKNHDTLPMGEFAIGTNTVAYAMAERFQIQEKLPILIAEKMGPHFAVGDTCYSWSEDAPMYNPDGREMVAKENERSALRREDVSKAYFGCHLDITVPYSELGDIVAVLPGGTRNFVIRGGRFAAEGTQKLNEALEGR